MSNVYASAASRIRASATVSARLGAPITVAPPSSHSSSSSSANGISQRMESMVVPLQGQQGGAQAEVTYMEAAGARDLIIKVSRSHPR